MLFFEQSVDLMVIALFKNTFLNVQLEIIIFKEYTQVRFWLFP